MKITARELNRSTLHRQLLLERARLDVAEGVRRVVALQAQLPGSPYVALWNRLVGFDPAELDAAFAERAVVKATLMRITLHAVHAEDYPVFREALQPTLYAAKLGSRTGLPPAEVRALVPGLVEFASVPRGSAEMKAWVEERVGAAARDGAWWGLKGYAPLHHHPTGGPWSFNDRPSYVAAGSGPLPEGPEGAPEALRRLVVRYLEGFGPASVADVAQFGMVKRAPVRRALGELGDAVERLEGPAGEELFDLVGAVRPDGATPAPARLLGMWDSVLLAYADRSRLVPPELRRTVIRVNGDVLPTLLVDGRVAGVWRPAEGGIEATAFEELPARAWEELAEEARSLRALLAGRDPELYARRYGHWWAKLPAGRVRLLPG
ncbi:winged helix DNA-binding domain-containing protein [Streptomyces sp. SKN60]|uniref:winged helix DNA-binding domain-containing protein n=1 Tax=Streptomyces sp. SKN60 TaxID=2855506 RepID=UPI00224748A2|nr:winged helix DNA-binding domain-containing protein [Streptomyces sp. SKN60]MCX2180147.1 winged helix DNA-binding domain-containing protein [Streptomyces sp. SKN60]